MPLINGASEEEKRRRRIGDYADPIERNNPLRRTSSSSSFSSSFSSSSVAPPAALAEVAEVFLPVAAAPPAVVAEGIAPVVNISLHEDDVVAGQGEFSRTHEGNIRYREIAAAYRDLYKLPSTTNTKKQQICIQVMNKVMENGGRFLDKDKTTPLEEEKIIRKIGQLLRNDTTTNPRYKSVAAVAEIPKAPPVAVVALSERPPIRDADVVAGQGFNMHSGNTQFKKIVMEYAEEYYKIDDSADGRDKKLLIRTKIMNKVMENGGRFLNKNRIPQSKDVILKKISDQLRRNKFKFDQKPKSKNTA